MDVLILSDGQEDTAKMAKRIAGAIKGGNVSVKTALDFKGNDLLPAKAFFLGCHSPEPESFAYIGDFLKHVNLAGRPCGIFSPGTATKYLAALLKDSEAALNPEHLRGSGSDIEAWVARVLPRG